MKDRERLADRDGLALATIASPVGELRVALTPHGIVKLSFPGGPRSDFNAWLRSHGGPAPATRLDGFPLLEDVRSQLAAYFSGELRVFKLPLDLHGSAFQLRVWRALGEIPYAETRTYGELARELGRPGAMRAVGAASGANPIPIILPCHRVVASGGRLGGFGGGVEVKRELLMLERRHVPPLTRPRAEGSSPSD